MSVQALHRESSVHGGFPDPTQAKAIHDEQDLHRAVEAYRFFYPTVSVEAIFEGNRAIGIEDGSLAILSASPLQLVLTANSDTPYMSAAVDLRKTGPLVIDLPPGPYMGLVDDHDQRWILDLGLPGPDRGRGGKHLVLPPDYVGDIPEDCQVGRSPTFMILLALRALPQGADFEGAAESLRNVKVYPLSDPESALPCVDASDRAVDTTPLRWEDNLEFWKHLHAIIDSESSVHALHPLYGELAALGIEKGKPFAPTARMKEILEEAARVGCEEMRVEAFASERPDRIVWPDRRWEWVGLRPENADFETDGHVDVEARDRWFFQAIITSPAMFRRSAGSGSIYFFSARDSSGAYLDGNKTYRLRVPAPVPASLFWSVTAYDAATRSQVRTAQNKAVLGSTHGALPIGDDGAIELYFGPEAPAGKEAQWIQTEPGAGFFLYFRIYGPTAEALDGTWKLDDLEPQRAVTTPASVETNRVTTSIGTLAFALGVPTTKTVTTLYDHLDHMRAVETYLDALAPVSMAAMRNGLAEVGIKDNEILLFPELMDAKSLWLTPNCDTIYFFGFLDLSDGPIVLEVPPKVLGVVDDMWSRWVIDFGMAGADRGEGGKYLFLPPGYEGPLPDGGFYVARSRTNHVQILGRAFLEEDDPAPAVKRINEGLKMRRYETGGLGSSVAAFIRGEGPFGKISTTPTTRIVEARHQTMSAILPDNRTFYELLDSVVQLEPAEALDPEIAGKLAAIGIVKGKAFRPDDRMQAILDDAVAVGSATARMLVFSPRAAEGFAYYGEPSRWMNTLFIGGYDFLGTPPFVHDGHVESAPNANARLLNSRTGMFYVAFGITPAMCMRLTGVGSQYLGTLTDAEGNAFDGAKTYALNLPPGIPAALFWSVTLYDNETRSMLDTPQRFPRAGSQAYPGPAATPNDEGSTTIVFGPTRPDGIAEGNFIQTMPGKGWFVLLRLYSPLETFFDKSWRPGEVKLYR